MLAAPSSHESLTDSVQPSGQRYLRLRAKEFAVCVSQALLGLQPGILSVYLTLTVRFALLTVFVLCQNRVSLFVCVYSALVPGM